MGIMMIFLILQTAGRREERREVKSHDILAITEGGKEGGKVGI